VSTSALDAALARWAAVSPRLLAVDFDGVLAPIVPHPGDARALRGALDSLRRMASAPGTTVAVVTGRARADLLALTGLGDDDPVHVIGSHGAEWGSAWGAATELDDDARTRLGEVTTTLEAIVLDHPGAHVETKPSAAVLHTRNIDAADAEAAAAQAVTTLADLDGVHVTRGKQVVEVSVVTASKGAAVARLREHLGARAVLYLGDDVTDETVFTTLDGDDVGVKVGEGRTAAGHQVDGPEDVRDLLAALAG
jgi:trehalose 6-phosphate phosphatase